MAGTLSPVADAVPAASSAAEAAVSAAEAAVSAAEALNSVGAQGPQGPQGLQGATMLSGTVAPTIEGVDGDFYIDISAWVGYGPKSAGAWPTGFSLVGAQGIQGIQGIQGNIGATGSTGAQGGQGIQGTAGLSVDHATRTLGNGAAGTTDTYTLWGDVAGTISLGTFLVYNGANGAGAGDMTKLVYDPANKNADAFSMANMAESLAAKILTPAERTAIATNTAKVGITAAQAAAITSNTSKVSNATHTGDVTGSGALTIVNSSVTLAKMANGTAGNLIAFSATGAPSAVATGAAGDVLTSNGLGAAPTMQAAAASGGGAGIADIVGAPKLGNWYIAHPYGRAGLKSLMVTTPTFNTTQVKAFPFLIEIGVTISAYQFVLNGTATGTEKVRMAIYSVDTNLQTATLIRETPYATLAAGGYAYAINMTALNLSAGLYLVSLICTAPLTYRSYFADSNGLESAQYLGSLGANACSVHGIQYTQDTTTGTYSFPASFAGLAASDASGTQVPGIFLKVSGLL